MKKSCKNDVSKNRNIEVKVMEVRVINLDSSIAFTKGFSTYLRKVSYKIPTSHIPWRLGILACDRLENDRKGCNSLGSTFKDLSLFMKKKTLAVFDIGCCLSRYMYTHYFWGVGGFI